MSKKNRERRGGSKPPGISKKPKRSIMRNSAVYNALLDEDELMSFSNLQKYSNYKNEIDLSQQLQAMSLGSSKGNNRSNRGNRGNSRNNNNKKPERTLTFGGLTLMVENDYMDYNGNGYKKKNKYNKGANNKNKGKKTPHNKGNSNNNNAGIKFVKGTKEESEEEDSDFPSYDSEDEMDPSLRTTQKNVEVIDLKSKTDQVEDTSEWGGNLNYINVKDIEEESIQMKHPFEENLDRGSNMEGEISSLDENVDLNNLLVNELKEQNEVDLIYLDVNGEYFNEFEEIKNDIELNELAPVNVNTAYSNTILIEEDTKTGQMNEVNNLNSDKSLINEIREIIEKGSNEAIDLVTSSDEVNTISESQSNSEDEFTDTEDEESNITDLSDENLIKDYMGNVSDNDIQLDIVNLDSDIDSDIFIDQPKEDFKEGFFYALGKMLKMYPNLNREEVYFKMKKECPHMFEKKEKKNKKEKKLKKNGIDKDEKGDTMTAYKTKNTSLIIQMLHDFLLAKNKRKITFPPSNKCVYEKIISMSSKLNLVSNCSGKGKKKVITCIKTKNTVIPESIQDTNLIISTSTTQKTIIKEPVVNKAPPISESNIGHKLLSKMGWAPGMTLGTSNNGLVNPIQAQIRSKRAGLGS